MRKLKESIKRNLGWIIIHGFMGIVIIILVSTPPIETRAKTSNINPLSNFTSVDELKDFLANDDTDTKFHIVITKPYGKLEFDYANNKIANGGKVSFNYQCEDRAFQLTEMAYKIGKRIEGEILTKAECIKYAEFLDTTPEALGAMGDDAHYINKAIIRNEVYFIEPANDKVWLAYDLD